MKIPTDVKDIKSIREFFTTIRMQICGMADYLSEPWKTHFNDLKKHYDDAIASLPPTDAVPAAMEANHHLSCFYSCLANANALSSMLGSAMDSMTKKNSETVALALNSAVDAKVLERIKSGELLLKTDVDGLVATAVTARATSGELVTKDTMTQFCSAAKEAGIVEGEKKVRAEIAAKEALTVKISDRKSVLQKCGLPLPDLKLESLLGGTDDEFAALQKTATDRIAALQKKNIALNSKSPLLMKVYLPQDQWEVFESLAVDNLKGGDPLLSPAPQAGERPAVMVC